MPRRPISAYGLPAVPGERPQPPDGMTEPELKIWRELTDGLPIERFDAAFVILARVLCQHIRYARYFGEEAERLLEQGALEDPDRRKVLRAAMRSHGEQSEKLGVLFTRLRLTPQSRVRAEKALLHRTTVGSTPLWDDWNPDAERKKSS